MPPQIKHTAIIDLGYRGVEVPRVEIIHRDRIKRLSAKARRLLKRCQAVEPMNGRPHDNRRTTAELAEMI